MAGLVGAALTALILCGALGYHVRVTSRFVSSILTFYPFARIDRYWRLLYPCRDTLKDYEEGHVYGSHDQSP